MKYKIGTQVYIIPLKINGAIISIRETAWGIEYEVRYFKDSKPEEVYFFPDEITTDIENKSTIGF